MERHKKYPHLVLAKVHEDFIGSLVVTVASKEIYLQFESEIDAFWEYTQSKTSHTRKATKSMVSKGYSQEVWLHEDFADCAY